MGQGFQKLHLLDLILATKTLKNIISQPAIEITGATVVAHSIDHNEIIGTGNQTDQPDAHNTAVDQFNPFAEVIAFIKGVNDMDAEPLIAD